MVRKMVLFAAAGLAAATVLATSPADASYRVIRWNVTGVCQIWDYGMPTRPFPLELPDHDARAEDVWRCATHQRA